MKSQKISQIPTEITPGRIYLLYLSKKKGFWPASVDKVIEYGKKTNIPAIVRFGLFDSSSSQQSSIDVKMQKTSSKNLIPFQNFYHGKFQSQYELKYINRSQKDLEQFKKAMRKAQQAFQSNLKTSSMYQALRKQSKNLKYQSQRLRNQSSPRNLQQTLSQASASKTQSSKITKETKSNLKKNQSKKTENRISPKIIKQNPQKTKQKSNSVQKKESGKQSKSNQASTTSSKVRNTSKNKKNTVEKTKSKDLKREQIKANSKDLKRDRIQSKSKDLKRDKTKVLINEDSAKNLQLLKKKRKNSKDYSIILVESHLSPDSASIKTQNKTNKSSIKVQNIVKNNSEKLEISSCRLNNKPIPKSRDKPQKKETKTLFMSPKKTSIKVENPKSKKIEKQPKIIQKKESKAFVQKPVKKKQSNSVFVSNRTRSKSGENKPISLSPQKTVSIQIKNQKSNKKSGIQVSPKKTIQREQFLKKDINLLSSRAPQKLKDFRNEVWHCSDTKVNYQIPFKHPNRNCFEDVSDSPFQILLGDSRDFQSSSQKAESQQLNQSRKTEFDRNEDDFGSFLSNLLPNVDIQKHGGNFRRHQKVVRSAQQYRNNPPEIHFSAKNTLTEIRRLRIENMHHGMNFQSSNISYPSTASASSLLMNSETIKGKNKKIRANKNLSNHELSNKTSLPSSQIKSEQIIEEKYSKEMETDSEDDFLSRLKQEIIRHLELIENEIYESSNLQVEQYSFSVKEEIS